MQIYVLLYIYIYTRTSRNGVASRVPRANRGHLCRMQVLGQLNFWRLRTAGFRVSGLQGLGFRV